MMDLHKRITSPAQLNDEGCLMLVSEIIKLAAQDYVYARRALAKEPDDKKARENYDIKRKFFLSDYFKVLSMGMDGKAMLDGLDRMEDGGGKVWQSDCTTLTAD